MSWTLHRLTVRVSRHARDERKAARATRNDSSHREHAEQRRIVDGTNAGLFASTRSPRSSGHVWMERAYERVRDRYSFDTAVELVPRADEARIVPARVEPPGIIRLPLGTDVWDYDELFLENGESLGYVSEVERVPSGGELEQVVVKGPCGESLLAPILTLEHLRVRFARGNPAAGGHRTVVLVAANDRDRPLDLGAEQAAIEQAIGWDCVRAVPAATPARVVEAVEEHCPQVLHFAGHSDRSALCLRDDLDAELEVTSDDFRSFLAGRGIELLVLNSCYSKAIADECLPHVSTVVGSTAEIGDEDACRFAAEFYKHMARGLPAGRALKNAIDVGRMHGGPGQFMLDGDGDLRLRAVVRSTGRSSRLTGT